MAANPLNPKKRIISKSFHRILDTQNRQVCEGGIRGLGQETDGLGLRMRSHGCAHARLRAYCLRGRKHPKMYCTNFGKLAGKLAHKMATKCACTLPCLQQPCAHETRKVAGTPRCTPRRMQEVRACAALHAHKRRRVGICQHCSSARVHARDAHTRTDTAAATSPLLACAVHARAGVCRATRERARPRHGRDARADAWGLAQGPRIRVCAQRVEPCAPEGVRAPLVPPCEWGYGCTSKGLRV